MNSKLIIFCSILISIQFVNSSLIESLKNLNSNDLSFIELDNGEFNKTFNIDLKEVKFYEAKKYKFGKYEYRQLDCDTDSIYGPGLCNRYEAINATCYNLNYQKKSGFPKWDCKFVSGKFYNKNISFHRTFFGCKLYREEYIQEPCMIKYYLDTLPGYNEKDDIPNLN